MTAAGRLGRVGVLRLAYTLLALLAMGMAPAARVRVDAGLPALAAAPADTIYALTGSGVGLLRFNSDHPSVVSPTITITGLQSGVVLKAIDFRPATGQLYGFGIHVPSMSGWLYVINPTTGVASRVGSAAFSTLLSASEDYDIDFNPGADRVRLIAADGLNLRVNPVTGALAGHDTDLHSSITSTQVYAGLAYAPRKDGLSAGTAYVYEQAGDTLYMLGGPDGNPSANAGLLTAIGPVGAFSYNQGVGLDISSGGQAYAWIQTGSTSGPYQLFTVNLSTASAGLVGTIGTGNTTIKDIAVVPGFKLYLPLSRK